MALHRVPNLIRLIQACGTTSKNNVKYWDYYELKTERRESHARLTLVTPKPSSLSGMEEERHNQNLSVDE